MDWMQPGARASAHFSFAELTARNRVPGADLGKLTEATAANLRSLATELEVIRADVGAAVHVTSGYRHGDPLQHGAGLAADIQVRALSPLDLVERIHALRAILDLRQVIAESLAADPASLTQPMAEGSGLWVHVAIRGPRWEARSARPWLWSVAPTSGRRTYTTWTPGWRP